MSDATEALRAWKSKIEAVDLWTPAVQGQVERGTIVYYAHITYRAGNLYFQSSVHKKLMPYAAAYVALLELDDIPIIMRRGSRPAQNFSRDPLITPEGRELAVVTGHLAAVYIATNPDGTQDSDIPLTIVYSNRLRWADFTPVTIHGQEVVAPAIIWAVAHELHHIKYPDETEDAIKEMTASFLAESVQWPSWYRKQEKS